MLGQPIVDANDARDQARGVLPRLVFDYIDGAAGAGRGDEANRQALGAIRLRPRVLQDVRNRTLGTSLFGTETKLPFGIAPMGMCNLSWPNADRWLAELAAREGVPIGVSTVASSSLEDMWQWSEGRAWFQLYFSGDGQSTMKLVERAKGAGYQTLVLTVDVPEVGRRPRELRQGFKMPFIIGPRTFTDFALHPRWSLTSLVRGAPSLGNFRPQDEARGYVFDREESRAGATFDWFLRLRDAWPGNLVIKGVLDAKDAVRLRDAGADAIQVSSHGGRQLESATLPIRALPRIRAAVGPDFPVFFDSGLRSGEDVAKVMALGADFGFFGRPLQFSIAARQDKGLAEYWNGLKSELTIAMAQVGLNRVTDFSAETLDA